MIRFIIFFGVFFVLTACRISKGYNALEEYNYFDAKHNFEKSLKRTTSPAAYGLSIIYLRDDNPFHNLDSAYHYGLLAVESYDNLKDRKKEKLAENFGFTLNIAKHHRAKISERFFELAVKENTVQDYKKFIANHPWSDFKNRAVFKRDSLAFEHSKKKNTSKAYRDYIKFYPESEQIEIAKDALAKAEFNETIIPNDPKSYVRFINKYPNNPFVDEAHARVYQLETKKNIIEVYDDFVKRYPDNPYVSDAWKNLYRLYISNYNKSTIESFTEKYPDFPFPELIEQDIQLVGRDMYLYKLNDKYGFMDENGLPFISPKYVYASSFSNGLAVVMEKDKFGYVNKNGDLIIDFRFDDAQDFSHGRAIVEVDDKIGLIDPTGKFILEPVYEDIGDFSEGVFYVQSEEGYRYYNSEGNPVFDITFDEAFSFDDGRAYVSKDGVNGFISRDGNFLVSSEKGIIKHFKDSIFVLEMRDSMNFIYPDHTLLHKRYFKRIGNLKEKRAMVSNEDAYGYVDDSANLIIPVELNPFPNYFQFAQFTNGHTIKKVGNNFAMIDSLGKKVLPAIFTGIGDYGELIPVTKGDQWGYTNKGVKLKIDYQFDYAYPFNDGLAFVEKIGKMGAIDLEGKVVIPIRYDDIERHSKNLFVYKLGGDMGLLNNEGEQIISNEYSRVEALNKNLFRLENNNKIDYYDVSKERLITLKKEDE
ncbi:MAG: WG repeat-containing protein [Brumimicrobium sp.]